MTLNEHETEVDRTRTRKDSTLSPEMHLAGHGLGIAGEAGEVADLIKKHVLHGHPLDRAKLLKELGDVQWYVTAIAHDAGFTLEEVMTANRDKLRARYPDGFTSADSIARRDVEEDRDNGGYCNS